MPRWGERRGAILGHVDDRQATDPGSAASRWAEALAAWAIPDRILAAAPESPWALPPGRFTVSARPGLDTSRAAAVAALGAAGRVLDVGCGGGAASMALVPPATSVTGVDPSAAMLANFASAAAGLGVGHDEVEGTWPDVAGVVAPADVVVCHHVVYNVAAIGPFVSALTGHAGRRVVVELTGRHPMSGLDPLWARFWGLPRPDEPSAELLVEVVRETGRDPVVTTTTRPAGTSEVHDADQVALVRRRLCLDPSRDADVRAALVELGPTATTLVTVSWDVGS